MNILTQETPGKVMALLGTAMFSLALLMGVSLNNQSFSNADMALSNPFGLENVVAVLDNTSNSFSRYVATTLVGPTQQDFAFLADSWHQDLAYVMDNTSDQIVAMAGLNDLVWVEPSPMAHAGFRSVSGNVAGAFSMNNTQ